ncbi:MarR family winged helix-turn-helix transcriptional regulator [Sporohalobacter salinus]|uniref:MarR family winged helix-turn-helix transcriptional regulator n=1 Tax=Sporohalobacter salinus TaxID=1494606 RepID=UPI001960487C|nr:MarR family winged helix-turn-helix transcriptional regulator [Sporohalobacter salinus]MBM7624265.1 DNA-binding MarR family transcriptional regulator [Sporohalobacter salinus]
MKLKKSLVQIINYFISLQKQKKEEFLKDELSSLTVNHFYYIDAIEKLKKPTFTDLAEELNVTKPSVSTMVNKLIAEGYVYKERSVEDGRVFHLYLKDKGKKIIDVETKAYNEFIRQIKSILNESQLKKLNDILAKILNNL